MSSSTRHGVRRLTTVGASALLVGLAGCGLGRGTTTAAGDGSAVPVVTSVVGATSGSGAAGGAPGGTRAGGGGAGGPGATAPSATGFSAAARGYGEPEAPMSVPATTAAQIGPDAPAVAEAARGFLAAYWAGGSRTWGQLADQLAPYATDTLLAGYRDPARVDRAAPTAAVGNQSVEVTEAHETTAEAIGRGTSAEGDRQVSVWRTLDLTRDDAGTWKVATLR